MGHNVAVLRGKFTALSASIKKLENSCINNLKLYLRKRRQEIIKIMTQNNKEKRKRKTYKEINEAKSCFFEKINKMD